MLGKYLKGQALQEAVEVLAKRAKVLEDVLKARFPAQFPTSRLDRVPPCLDVLRPSAALAA